MAGQRSHGFDASAITNLFQLICLVIIIQGLPVRSVSVPTFLQRRIVQTACFGQLHPQ
jgi:hypothetical protein